MRSSRHWNELIVSGRCSWWSSTKSASSVGTAGCLNCRREERRDGPVIFSPIQIFGCKIAALSSNESVCHPLARPQASKARRKPILWPGLWSGYRDRGKNDRPVALLLAMTRGSCLAVANEACFSVTKGACVAVTTGACLAVTTGAFRAMTKEACLGMTTGVQASFHIAQRSWSFFRLSRQ
jgi:hypothetical protein